MNGKNFLMNDELQAIFDGALLSDGSLIQKSRLSAYFSMSLTIKNKDWIMKIADTFTRNDIKFNIRTTPARIRISKGNVINESPGIRISTPFYRNLLSERLRWYPNGVKVVPPDLNLKNPETMAGWYMGDGNISIPRRRNTIVTLHTNGFDIDSVKILQVKLSEMGITANMRRKKTNQFLLKLTRLHAEAFVDLIKNHVTDSFTYKTKIDKWVPASCSVCSAVMDVEKNLKKYCDQCVPRAVDNLRKSRRRNMKYNKLRNAKRAIGTKRDSETSRDIIQAHSERMMEKKVIAEERKTKRKRNKELLDDMISKHMWPTTDQMRELVELSSLSEISRAIGVSVTCVSMKCKKLGLTVKAPEYWSHRTRMKAKDISHWMGRSSFIEPSE